MLMCGHFKIMDTAGPEELVISLRSYPLRMIQQKTSKPEMAIVSFRFCSLH